MAVNRSGGYLVPHDVHSAGNGSTQPAGPNMSEGSRVSTGRMHGANGNGSCTWWCCRPRVHRDEQKLPVDGRASGVRRL